MAILACATLWALCLGLGFKRLVTLDIMLYGAALMLEFVTLVALRIREPQLKREFRVPGGLTGAILAGVFPLALSAHRGLRKRKPVRAGDERACFWRADHGGGIWRVCRDAKTAQAHDRGPTGGNR